MGTASTRCRPTPRRCASTTASTTAGSHSSRGDVDAARAARRPRSSSAASASRSRSTAQGRAARHRAADPVRPDPARDSRRTSGTRWRAGLRQRVTALNRFLHDVYHDQEILKAGHRARPSRSLGNAQFRPEMMGVDVPGGVYSHIAGIDIVRAGNADGSGSYYVLEDNLRVPSGVSYMLENRKMMMRLFPELFSQHRDRARSRTTPTCCSRPCARSRRRRSSEPTVVVLTPGHVQQRLLRARVPGAADGRRAGRGPGPVRQGRLRLHAHDAGSEARRRDLPPRRRRLPRPAGLPRRLDARLRRPARRLPRRQRRRSRTRSAPASPTTSRSTRTCRR